MAHQLHDCSTGNGQLEYADLLVRARRASFERGFAPKRIAPQRASQSKLDAYWARRNRSAAETHKRVVESMTMMTAIMAAVTAAITTATRAATKAAWSFSVPTSEGSLPSLQPFALQSEVGEQSSRSLATLQFKPSDSDAINAVLQRIGSMRI